jgi:hypothetical protein
MDEVVVHEAMALDTWFNAPIGMQKYGTRLGMHDEGICF